MALFGLVFCVLVVVGAYLWWRHDAAVVSTPVKIKAKDIPPKDVGAERVLAPVDDKGADVKEPTDLTPIKVERSGELKGQDVYKRLLKSAVWINNPGMGWGTGTLVNAEDKLVVTNYHVVYRGSAQVTLETLKTIEDKLVKSDPVSSPFGLHFKSYEFEFLKKNVYQIDMTSETLDSYVRIVDATGNVLVEEDRILNFRPPSDGKLRVQATTFGGGLGDFTLVISRVEVPKKGKAAGPKVASVVEVNFPEFAPGGQPIVDKVYYKKLNKANKEKCKAQVLFFSETNDLAILKLNYLPPGVLPLPLAKEAAQPGQAVHSIGNPGRSGALWVYTSGTVRTPPYKYDWVSHGEGITLKHNSMIIETQSPTNPGDSGGPLVNDHGEMVAVTQGVNLGANSINLFIDVQEVRDFLKSHKFRWVE